MNWYLIRIPKNCKSNKHNKDAYNHFVEIFIHLRLIFHIMFKIAFTHKSFCRRYCTKSLFPFHCLNSDFEPVNPHCLSFLSRAS